VAVPSRNSPGGSEENHEEFVSIASLRAEMWTRYQTDEQTNSADAENYSSKSATAALAAVTKSGIGLRLLNHSLVWVEEMTFVYRKHSLASHSSPHMAFVARCTFLKISKQLFIYKQTNVWTLIIVHVCSLFYFKTALLSSLVEMMLATRTRYPISPKYRWRDFFLNKIAKSRSLNNPHRLLLNRSYFTC
jgi:hypothetical protein